MKSLSRLPKLRETQTHKIVLIETVTYRGCEYLYYEDSNGNGHLTHAGDCDNCKAEMKRIVEKALRNHDN